MSRTSNRRVALLAELEDRTLLTHTVTTPVPITAQVLAYAKSHLGQQVGDGQCNPCRRRRGFRRRSSVLPARSHRVELQLRLGKTGDDPDLQ